MYEINEEERCVEIVDRWTIGTLKYIEDYLELEVELSNEDRWEVLKRCAEYANRMDVRITAEVIEGIIYEYIEEKGE